VEFLNTWKENNKQEVFARIGDKVVVVDKHILGERFKISAKGLKEKKKKNRLKRQEHKKPLEGLCYMKPMWLMSNGMWLR
jgi:hypothetical protein